MNTAPQLFAIARGIDVNVGPYRCFFCGGECNDSLPSQVVVKDSFTSRDTVCGGEYVCRGCVAAMDEDAEIQLADGEVRQSQKVRGYSWVISKHAIACTKSHRAWLCGICLAPPAPPFVISISDSGQKHLLYRAVVCHSRDVITITLEGERVTYRPVELTSRMLLCRKLIAATGKPALAESVTPRFAMNVIGYHRNESLITTWLECREQSLSRLATWLSPAKESCLSEFPVTSPTVSAGYGAI